MWKCSFRSGTGITCGRVFYHSGPFREHTRSTHSGQYSPGQFEDVVSSMHIASNAHKNFWCGFCRKLVANFVTIHTALEGRYKHIGDHFDKDEMHIKDWICVEANKPKEFIDEDDRERSRSHACYDRNDEDSDLGDSGIPTTEPVSRDTSSNYHTTRNNKRQRVEYSDTEADADAVSDYEI